MFSLIDATTITHLFQECYISALKLYKWYYNKSRIDKTDTKTKGLKVVFKCVKNLKIASLTTDLNLL